MADADLALIEAFADALWLERGLSANTLAAYQADLRAFVGWLDQNRQGVGLAQASRLEVLDYLALLAQQGIKPRSAARRLSCLRQFYQYLLRLGTIREDPSARVDAPRLGRPLPRTLTEAEVERLLAAPDTQDARGHRDRTMLEVLYATGLRVSELVDLQPGQVSLTQGLVRVMGKGGKERLVPFGEAAHDWLERYLRDARPALLGGRDCAFVNPWAGKGVDMYRDGKKVETLKGDRITLKTRADDTVVLVAEGAAAPERL